MEGIRLKRVEEQVRTEVAALLLRGDIKDPRVDSFLSITRVALARDGSHAKVFVSTFKDEASLAAAVAGFSGTVMPFSFARLKTGQEDQSLVRLAAIARFTELASLPLPVGREAEFRALVELDRVEINYPITSLIHASQHFGYVDSDPDLDGTHRRVRLVRVFADRIYLHLSLVTFLQMCGVDLSALEPTIALYPRLKGMEPVKQHAGMPIDAVFIGSCTNSRIEDMREAAAVVKNLGRKVASNVKLAMVVPGSGLVKEQAEREGLDKIFVAAGFEWREPGCSMCLAMNGDELKPGERCASTSNRNFEGRQGKGGRTHLVSPEMAAAAALAGHFVDIRTWN